MDAYQLLKKYLKIFIDNHFNIDSIDLSFIKKISEKNKVWSIIQYVNDPNNSDNLKSWEKNKNDHYERIRACDEIFKILENKYIPYSIIKGAYLDKIAYKNIGLRSSRDIDILIEKKNYKILNKLLYEYGFICGEWDYEKQCIIAHSRETILYNYMYTHQSASYIKTTGTSDNEQIIEVDLNFSVSWGEDINGILSTEQLLKDSIIIEYDRFNYKILNPEKFLLQICLHSYRDMNSIILIKEGMFNIRLLCDIYYYIVYSMNILNPDRFIKLCKQLKYDKYVYYVLYYTTEVFGEISWIEYVKNLIKPDDLKYLNTFGLSDDEKKIWNIDFQERIICENLYEVIQPLLSDKDIKKIESINNNM